MIANPDLYAVTWRLTGIDDVTEQVARIPTGYQVLRFWHTSGYDGHAVAGTRVRDGEGNSSIVVIEQDQMKFDKWMNDLVGRFAGPASPPRPGIPSGPLTRQARHFVFAVLTGTTHWSLHDTTLTLTKPETGSLTFQADRDA